MKKYTPILIGTVIILCCLSYHAIRPVVAAQGDIEITLIIRADKVADFQEGFLARYPIPLVKSNDPNAAGGMEQQYSPKQWIEVWVRGEMKRAYRRGKLLLAQRAAIIDPDPVQ